MFAIINNMSLNHIYSPSGLADVAIDVKSMSIAGQAVISGYTVAFSGDSQAAGTANLYYVGGSSFATVTSNTQNAGTLCCLPKGGRITSLSYVKTGVGVTDLTVDLLSSAGGLKESITVSDASLNEVLPLAFTVNAIDGDCIIVKNAVTSGVAGGVSNILVMIQ